MEELISLHFRLLLETDATSSGYFAVYTYPLSTGADCGTTERPTEPYDIHPHTSSCINNRSARLGSGIYGNKAFEILEDVGREAYSDRHGFDR